MELMTKTRFDFMGYRRVSGFVSIALVLASIISLFTFKLNFGIDFTGGTLVEVAYKHKADLEKIRDALRNAGYEKYVVKYYGTENDVHINIAPKKDSGKSKSKGAKPAAGGSAESIQNKAAVDSAVLDQGQQVMLALKSTSDKPIELRRSDFVGSQVGEELTEDGGLALLTALICILVYVAMRFEFRFAVGSVMALAHDVIIILGIFSITQMEFDLSVLAALLAIIGYSLNDTIVVFDRIRENFRKIRKGTTVEVMNISLNETLSRTIVTSLTTLLVVVTMVFFGGEALFGFSIALALGIMVGTYSSIYVASNAALWLKVSRQDLVVVKKEGEDLEEMGP